MGEQADAQDAAKRWSKAADEKIRKQFLAESRRICDDKVRAFVDCSKENGLMVIFRCREENKIMNECVQNYTTDEKWEQFRKEKIVSADWD